MYLPQAATSLPPSIGAQWDLFPCLPLAQKSQFEPTVIPFGPVVSRCSTAQLRSSVSR